MRYLFALTLFLGTTAVFAQNKDSNFHLDQNYKIQSSGTLKMSIHDAKLELVGSTRADAHVKIDRTVTSKGFAFGKEEFSVEVKEENGNLTIQEKGNSVGFMGYFSSKYELKIEVSSGISLDLEADDGHFHIENINGAITIKSDDANIDLVQCKGSAFTLRTNDGKVNMDRGEGFLEFRGEDANIDVKNAAFSGIRATINDGHFNVESSLTNNGQYYVKTNDGSVDFTISAGGGKFDVTHNDGHVSTHGNFNVTEKSDNRSHITLADGTAQVEIETNDGNVRLKQSN